MMLALRVSLLVAVLTTSARADEPARAKDAARAARLFEQGRALRLQGKLQQACERFQASFELERAPGTMLNLADCAQADGDPERAWQLFDAAAREFAARGEPERASFARNRADAVLARAAAAERGGAGAQAPRSEPHSDDATRTGLKIAIVSAFATSAVAAGFWAHGYLAVRDFDGSMGVLYDHSGQPVTVSQVTPADCDRFEDAPAGTPGASNDFNLRFDAACAGHRRTLFAIPLTITTAAIGLVASIYLARLPSGDRHRVVTLVPAVTDDGAGAALHARW